MESIVLRYDKGESIGSINSVDTGMATAIIDSDDVLSQLQINQLIAIQSPKSGRYIIAMIVKIYRKATDMTLNDDEDEEDTSSAFNQVRLVFVGEFMDKAGEQSNVFRRNVMTYLSTSSPHMVREKVCPIPLFVQPTPVSRQDDSLTYPRTLSSVRQTAVKARERSRTWRSRALRTVKRPSRRCRRD